MDTLTRDANNDAPVLTEGVVDSATDFPALFQRYLLNGAAQALEQVHTQPDLVQQPDVRENVLHMLTFALEAPAAYAMAREMVRRLTPVMEQAGLWERWIFYLQRASKQGQIQQDPLTEAYCCFWLGQLYQNRGDFAAAHSQWRTALQHFATVGDRANQAKTLNRLAYLARLERCFADGDRLVSEALELLTPDDPERAFSYFVQGVLAFDRQQWSIAITHFQASLVISEQQGDQVTVARRLRNLGPALRAAGRYDEAIACYQRAIALFAEVYDPVQQAVTEMNLGVVYLLLEQPHQSLASFQRSEPIFRNAQDRWHLATLYTNQGIACRMLGHWAQAQAQLEASVDLWRQLDNIEEWVNALDELGLVYLAQQAWAKAAFILQSALTLLARIEQDPAYPSLHRTVAAHHAEAIGAVVTS
ncbi:MAG: tetratricopeptide repeat protein [Caldilineaceae bacterium]